MDYMFVFHNDKLVPIGYTYSQPYKNSHRSTSSFMFTLGGVTVSWRSVKKSYIVDSTMKVEYVATFEIAREVV